MYVGDVVGWCSVGLQWKECNVLQSDALFHRCNVRFLLRNMILC